MVITTGKINQEVQVTQELDYDEIQLGSMLWDTDKGLMTQVYRYFKDGVYLDEETLLLEGAEFEAFVGANVELIQAVRAASIEVGKANGIVPADATDTWPTGA